MSRLDRIYISSSCGREAIRSFFPAASDEGRYLGLELGFAGMAEAEVRELIACAQRNSIPMIAHNYFLPEPDDVVINLSDPVPSKRKMAIDYAVSVLDFCAENNIASYSIHAGFACSFSPEHFVRVASQPPIPMQQAYDLFLNGLDMLAAHAESLKVGLLFENNVLPSKNLTDGLNKHLLCVDSEGILYVLRYMRGKKITVLLDLGHLKVSAATLGLSPEEEARRLAKFVGQVHVHDNGGEADLHGPASRESWFWNLPLPASAPLIIEQPGAGKDMITSQIALLREMRRAHAR